VSVVSDLVRILLLGTGGREHALAKALASDPSVTELTCAPGNPGMALLQLANGRQVECADVAMSDLAAIADLAADRSVDLVVVGPEAPLVAGVSDVIERRGIACFGPSQAAAAIEGSKTFAKDVMRSAGVPSADARTCSTAAEVAAALSEFEPPYVVKDDGLAAGKGVVVTADLTAATEHAQHLLDAGRPVIVEEYLSGPEVSLFAVCDGKVGIPLMPAQDFKRIGDADTGPNTGGMGAYAPLDWAPERLVDDVMTTVVTPTLAEMARRDVPFAGLLYVGLVITAGGPKVIEFNCRFGDPETQVVLPLLATPLAGLLYAATDGRLAEQPPLRWHEGAAVTVVIAAEGYPIAPKFGDVIGGAERDGVLQSGTVRSPEDGTLRSAGGRVLSCVGTGATLAAARAAAYAIVDDVSLPGAQHRRDIASAAVENEVRVPVQA
jgi:phosphoribosylamine--glycine ligase